MTPSGCSGSPAKPPSHQAEAAGNAATPGTATPIKARPAKTAR